MQRLIATTRELALGLLLTLPGLATGDEIFQKPPKTPDSGAYYVFYLHGQIVQDAGPRPIHPRYGLYDYPLILETLAGHGLTIISEQRKKGTDSGKYAKTVAKQVRGLLDDGLAPEHITVIGFSMGGYIAIKVSSLLPDAGINFVFMASCSDWMSGDADARIHGRVLSVYELSDSAYSCKELASRSPGPSEYRDIPIDTGKEHGAFYLPDERWVVPVVDWIKSSSPSPND